MSQPSESESLSERFEGFEAPFDRLREVYHVPVLAALLAFMLWVRVRHYERFYVDGRVLFSGNDAWYHSRMVQYTVNEFPATMPFEVWTSFPSGTTVGQFGTLYDQLIALGALIYGLGSPTELQVQTAVLFAPAIFGVLVAIPAYLIGARLAGKGAGLVSALIVALTPGQFLTRSLVGFSDHHVAEALFMSIAVYALLLTLDVAMRDKPAWELVQSGEWDALRPTLVYAALTGVATGIYIWVWPPGIFFVGILALFFGVATLGQYLRGVSPDHLAIPAVTIGVITAVMTAIPFQSAELSPVRFTLIQPGLSLAFALGVVVIAAGARFWDARSLDRRGFPTAMVGLGFAAALVVSLVAPDLFGFLLGQIERIVGLGASATALTVGEAQPPGDATQFLYNSYGLAFATGVAGVLLILYRVVTDRELAPELLFVAIWFVFLTLATLTQQRFDYYLVLAVGATNAVLVTWVLSLVDAGDLLTNIRNVSAYQVLTILAVVLILTAPLAFRPASGGYQNAVSASDRAGPGGVQNWDSSLAWVSENTPQQGAYGSGGPGDLEYYGTYQPTDDFDYPEGSYGIMSWWDYGHWITVLGERIPVANPFQQNARQAANFLLADEEAAANELMVSDDGEQTRYVMLDYQMGLSGTRKFSAPAAWETRENVSSGDLSRPVYVVSGNQVQLGFAVQSQRSMESMRTRLYQYHGSATGPASPSSAAGSSVVVADWDVREFGNGQSLPVVPQDGQPVKVFENVSAAESYVRQDGSAQVGGILGEPAREVAALEHYRLVHASEESAETPVSRAYRFALAQQGQQAQPIEIQPWVKTFERVPGATVEGSGAPANTTVTAAVRMRTSRSTFTYTQTARTDENGEFTMTLPYSTTGYDEYGPENGYTNVSVRAVTSYQFTTPANVNETSLDVTRYNATADVTEGQVVGAEDGPVTVQLEKQVISEPEGADSANGTEGNTSESLAAPTTTPALLPPTRG